MSRQFTVSAPLSAWGGGQLLVPNFEKGVGGGGQKKMSAWGDLRSSCHRYLGLGLCLLGVSYLFKSGFVK